MWQRDSEIKYTNTTRHSRDRGDTSQEEASTWQKYCIYFCELLDQNHKATPFKYLILFT